jgi:hypothetical protein
MAIVEFRGYVNDYKTRDVSSGVMATYRVSCKQKEKTKVNGQLQEKVSYASFYVTDFTGSTATEGDYIEVKGYLTVSSTEKDGKTYQNLRVKATEVQTIGQSHAKEVQGKEAEKDPWE